MNRLGGHYEPRGTGGGQHYGHLAARDTLVAVFAANDVHIFRYRHGPRASHEQLR